MPEAKGSNGSMPPQSDALNVGQEPETNSGDASAKAKTTADDTSKAPEQESDSRLPDDPRPLHETQPPTKEQF